MAKHFENKNNILLLIFIIILVFTLIGFITYSYIKPSLTNTIIDQAPTMIKTFENAPQLHSDEFILTEENGICTINGKIYNSSINSINNLSCIYTLKDINNNDIYEFTVFAEKILPESYFSFTSVLLLDLSNVVDYSVKSLNDT